MRNLPPLNALKAFEAAARRGSMTAAGLELNVTHGAVSRQVALLEDWLGVTVFQRAHSGLKLTDHGRIFFGEVSAALDRLALAAMQISHTANVSQLIVSAPPTFETTGTGFVAVYVSGASTSDPSVATATSFDSSPNDVSTVTFLPGVFDPSKPLPRFFCQVYQASNLFNQAHTLHILNVQTNVVDGSITVTVAIASGGTFGNQGYPLPPGFMSENYSIVGIQ